MIQVDPQKKAVYSHFLSRFIQIIVIKSWAETQRFYAGAQISGGQAQPVLAPPLVTPLDTIQYFNQVKTGG